MKGNYNRKYAPAESRDIDHDVIKQMTQKVHRFKATPVVCSNIENLTAIEVDRLLVRENLRVRPLIRQRKETVTDYDRKTIKSIRNKNKVTGIYYTNKSTSNSSVQKRLVIYTTNKKKTTYSYMCLRDEIATIIGIFHKYKDHRIKQVVYNNKQIPVGKSEV